MPLKKTWKRKIRSLIYETTHVLVPLSDGISAAVIDIYDAPLAEGWNWSVRQRGALRYAARGATDGRPRPIYLHSLILPPRPGFLVDHIDRDGLNNCRANLRYATFAQNTRNRSIASNNTSGFKGVTFRKDRGKWLAEIRCNNRLIKIGLFGSAEEAARAYDIKAHELFGEFAFLNFGSGT